MKKLGILSLIVLVGLPGCWGRKTVKTDKNIKQCEIKTNRAVSVADSGIRSFFDDELGEFTNTQELFVGELAQELTVNDFALIEKTASDFDVVYFDFDSYELKADQEQSIKKAVVQIKKTISENKFFGDNASAPCISIAGNSDSIYVNPYYNIVLSEKRAKVLKDRLVKEGIPAELIKIVGYGSEMPVIVDGKPVTGDRVQQAPNRRDEIRILYS